MNTCDDCNQGTACRNVKCAMDDFIEAIRAGHGQDTYERYSSCDGCAMDITNKYRINVRICEHCMKRLLFKE